MVQWRVLAPNEPCPGAYCLPQDKSVEAFGLLKLCMSISSGAQYVKPCKSYFSHPSLVICFLATPLMKLNLHNKSVGELLGNSKPTGTIIMMGQSETLNSSQIIFITLFLQFHRVTALFTSHSKLCNYAEPKPFS
jgi:hypothetical protein